MQATLGAPNNRIKIFVLLAVVTTLAFSRVIAADFLNWDDPAHILENKFVTEFSWSDPLKVFFEKNSANSTYIPLTTLNFAVEYKLFGKNPMVFHLSSLFQHILVVFMVFLIALRLGLGQGGALAAAFLFALHPARVENIAWATSRKDTLYGLFYLISIWFYIRYLNTQNLPGTPDKSNRYLYYAAALGCGFLSILAKPMALSLPWILWLIDWMSKRRFTMAALVDKLPFFFVMEGIAWITYAQNSRDIDFEFVPGMMTWLWSASFYIKRFFYPFDLSPIYSIPEPVAPSNPAYILALGILIATAVLLWFFRRNRWVIFAFAYFVLSIFFIWRFDARDISFVADRFLYVPAFAACLAVGRLWEFLDERIAEPPRKRIFYGASAGILAVLGLVSFMYIGMWKDGMTLWNAVVKRSPQVAFGYNNRGMIYLGEGKKEEALADFNMALEVARQGRIYKDGKILISAARAAHYAKAYYNMGILEAKDKKYEEALKYFNLALYYDMGQAEYFNNRGATLIKLEHRQEALNDYNAALVIDPENYEAQLNRGLLYYKMGDKDEAMKGFQKLIESNPRVAEPYLQAGRIYFERDNLEGALEMFLAAAKAEPEHAQAYYNLGVIYNKMGDKDKARDNFSQAQLKWIAAPDKYTLPGLKPEDAKVWSERLQKNAL